MTKQNNLYDLLNQEKVYEKLIETGHKDCQKHLHIIFNTLRDTYCSSSYEQIWEKIKGRRNYVDDDYAEVIEKLDVLSFKYGKESNFLDYCLYEYNPNELTLSLRYNNGRLLSIQDSIVVPLSAIQDSFFIEANNVSMVYTDKLLTWYNKEWVDAFLRIKEIYESL